MVALVCDICGDQIDSEVLPVDRVNPADYPNGFFTVDYHPLHVTEDRKPSHFGYSSFHTCPRCLSVINRSIFDTIGKMRETMYRPTAIVSVGAFPPDPVVMTPTECSCEPTARG